MAFIDNVMKDIDVLSDYEKELIFDRLTEEREEEEVKQNIKDFAEQVIADLNKIIESYKDKLIDSEEILNLIEKYNKIIS